MYRVCLLHPRDEHGHFDMDYYLNTYMPQVQEKLGPYGLAGYEVDRGLGGATPISPPPFAAIGYLYFEDINDFKISWRKEGKEIMAMYTKFTTVEPDMLVGEIADEPAAGAAEGEMEEGDEGDNGIE